MKSEFNRKPVRFLRTKKMYLPLQDETVSNLKPAALPVFTKNKDFTENPVTLRRTKI